MNERIIVAADKALASGSADELVQMVTESVAEGIRQRYDRAAEAFKHKDESVQLGRDYVAAYVDYSHNVERLQMASEKPAAHHGAHARKAPAAPVHDHGHGK